MQSVAVSDLVFHQRLASLLRHAGQRELWNSLITFLRFYIGFDSWVVMVFRADKSPIVLADDNVDNEQKFREYLNSLYRMDPFYQFARTRPAANLYRIADVCPEHFYESEYYNHYFLVNIISDEIQFLCPLGEDAVFSLSLGSKKKFSQEELGILQLYSPWILALVETAQGSPAFEGTSAANEATAEEVQEEARQWLLDHADPALTKREFEIASLILDGQTSKTIAWKLNISMETVKIHKRNMYRKLNASSQYQLFVKFLSRDR